jgi:enoyl-CoA hydratase
VDAIAQELAYGKHSLAADTLAGTSRFTAGAGRHGQF